MLASQNVTLVIKARQGFGLDTLKSSWDPNLLSHPFSEVIVMSDDGTPIADLDQFDLPVTLQRRSSSPIFMDLCNAKVKTDWFMIIDDRFKLLDDFQVHVTMDDGRPLQGTTLAASEPCLDSPGRRGSSLDDFMPCLASTSTLNLNQFAARRSDMHAFSMHRWIRYYCLWTPSSARTM